MNIRAEGLRPGAPVTPCPPLHQLHTMAAAHRVQSPLLEIEELWGTHKNVFILLFEKKNGH